MDLGLQEISNLSIDFSTSFRKLHTLVCEMDSSNSATQDEANSAVNSFDDAEPTLVRIREEMS